MSSGDPSDPNTQNPSGSAPDQKRSSASKQSANTPSGDAPNQGAKRGVRERGANALRRAKDAAARGRASGANALHRARDAAARGRATSASALRRAKDVAARSRTSGANALRRAKDAAARGRTTSAGALRRGWTNTMHGAASLRAFAVHSAIRLHAAAVRLAAWLLAQSRRALAWLRVWTPHALARARAEILRTPEHARALRVALRTFDYRRLHPRELWKLVTAGYLRVRKWRRRLRAWVQEVRACGDGAFTLDAFSTWMRENDVKFGIGAQFFSALGGAVALILLASLVGLISLTQVSSSQARVNQEVVPSMRVAFRVARASSELVAATPRLMAVTTRAEYEELATEVRGVRADFEESLAALDPSLVSAEEFAALRELGGALIANIENVDDTVAKELELRPLRARIEAGLVAAQRQLDAVLDGAIDDQFFFLATGHRALNQQPVGIGQRQSIQEVMAYRWFQTLRAEGNNAFTLMENALSLPDRAYLPATRERYDTTVRRIETSLKGLESNALHEPLGEAVATLLELGGGEEGVFAVRDQELALAEALEEYLRTSRELAVGLGLQAEKLTTSSSSLAQATSTLATRAVNTGRTVLIALNALSLAGAVLIAWLYVGRVLLHRIGELSTAMLRMADGDLRVPLDIRGRDEVAEMGRALEVFRKHALEAQRLNLVEKLAEELRNKNVELERAQDQIVMREKLAALGELTAGIAHEIKNPLNFVNNFSQLSMELITEIQEILGAGKKLSDEQREELKDIFDDLNVNLEKINEHGKRADSIVKGMLRHGRGGGAFIETDMNAMLSEYARLAYHSARATNAEFNVTLHEEFDENVGMVEVVPQDWSRVLLNLVTNACDATDEKRRREARGSYNPEIWLITKRLGDEVEIRVCDNGPGISEDVREKMFNPFFTTKPTDKGTGLGLSMSHDIVQQHRGTLSVESEMNVRTEMIIRVPVHAAVEEGEDADADAPTLSPASESDKPETPNT